MTLSHEERAERRKQIAEFCKNNSVADAAKRFGLTSGTIRSACIEHGVQPIRDPSSTGTVQTMRILKRLLDGETQVKLAGEYRVSRQRVQQIQKTAEEAGFKFGGDNGKH